MSIFILADYTRLRFRLFSSSGRRLGCGPDIRFNVSRVYFRPVQWKLGQVRSTVRRNVGRLCGGGDLTPTLENYFFGGFYPCSFDNFAQTCNLRCPSPRTSDMAGDGRLGATDPDPIFHRRSLLANASLDYTPISREPISERPGSADMCKRLSRPSNGQLCNVERKMTTRQDIWQSGLAMLTSKTRETLTRPLFLTWTRGDEEKNLQPRNIMMGQEFPQLHSYQPLRH